MMKKIFSAALLACSICVSAQTVLDDFETSYNSWGSVDAASVMQVNNPYQTGLNLSCRVLRVERSGGNNWAGGLWTLPSQLTGNYVHILMYREGTDIHSPNLKVTDNTPSGMTTDITPMSGTTIVAGEWQDVVFNVSGYPVDFIFVMPDRQGNAVIYIDDIILSDDATPRSVPNEECTLPEPPTPGEDGYTLMWNEDFTEDSFDLRAWNIETTGNPANNELQYYSNRGVSIERDPAEGKQCLVLTARKEDMGGRNCTSGRVTTQNKVLFQYGKIEARIWFPNTANGLWPAFWMMGNDISSVSWPACGETDIIELGNSGAFSAGTQDRYFNGASHWGQNSSKHQQSYNTVTYPYSVEDGFHTFTCIWDSVHVAMYVDLDTHPDAQPYYQRGTTYSSDPNNAGYYFNKPNFVLLNLAIGGDFPGIRNVNSITALSDGPRMMYIDWVRIYQKGDAGEQFSAGSASDEIEEADPNWRPAATENVETVKAMKMMSPDGQLIICRDGAVYNVLGQAIR